MSQDKKIPTVETNTSETTERFSGGVKIAVLDKDSPLGKQLGSLMEHAGGQPMGADILSALVGAGHRFIDIAGGAGTVFRPTPEQARLLLAHLQKQREPRPEHQSSGTPILNAMSSRVPKGHPFEAVFSQLFGDQLSPCGECSACKGEDHLVEETLAIAEAVGEGAEALHFGITMGATDDMTDEDKQKLRKILKRARKELKVALASLD